MLERGAGTREVEGAEERAASFAAGFPMDAALAASLFTGFRTGRRARLRTRCTLLLEQGIPFSTAFATTSLAGMSAGRVRMNSVSGDLGRPTRAELAATALRRSGPSGRERAPLGGAVSGSGLAEVSFDVLTSRAVPSPGSELMDSVAPASGAVTGVAGCVRRCHRTRRAGSREGWAGSGG